MFKCPGKSHDAKQASPGFSFGISAIGLAVPACPVPPPHREFGAEPRSATLLWNSVCFSILPGSHIFDKLKIMPKLRSIWGDSNANILDCLVNFENYDSETL